MIPLGLLSWRSGACLSGRSAAWLARLVRDQEAGGSNPLAPTILPIQFSHWLDTDAQPKHKDRLMQHHRISCSEKLQRFSPEFPSPPVPLHPSSERTDLYGSTGRASVR